MITAARPTSDGASHYYWPEGRPAYDVPKKDGGMRKTTISDCRKLGLLPSPTTILKLLAKPQLQNWIVEQGCLAVLTSPRREGEELDAFVHRVLHVDREHDQERDAAAEMGTAIHDALELALCNVDYPRTLAAYVVPVMAELAAFGRVAMTEKILVGDGYAGRTDAVFDDTRMITVCDFKGCNKLPERGPWDEHLMQIGSYCGALGNTGEQAVQGCLVYINRNIPGEVAVHLVPDWQPYYRRFRLLLEYWKLTNDIGTYAY